MLLVFLTSSLFGQSVMQLCLCSGEIAAATSEVCPCCPHEAEPCGDCEHEDQEESPCQNGDCTVFISMPDFGVVPAATHREITSEMLELPGSYLEFRCSERPRVLSRPPFLRPPGPRSVPLNVLYGSFLI